MSKSTVGIVAVVILLIALWVADVFATHAIFTSRYPGANDFAGRYAGARVFWVQGLSPYSDEATRQAQILLHGRTLTPEEIKEGIMDVSLFVYPFYMVFWLAPIAILPYAWAEAAWLSMLEFALVGGLVGAISLVRWRQSPLLLAINVVWAVLIYHSARAVLLGQFAIVVFLLNVMTLLALRARRDVLAGVLLAVSTTKPQMAFLIVPLVLFWAWARRRWRVLIAFAVVMAVLCGLSFIILPSWVDDFLRQVMSYPSYTDIGSPVWIIAHSFIPAMGTPGEVALSLAFAVWMLVMWALLWRDESWPTFVWTASFTLIVTNLIGFRTATTNYVVLFIPLFWALAALQTQWKRGGTASLFAIQAVLLVGLWRLFLTTLVNKNEHPIMYLPLPLGLLVVLVWGRRWLTEYLATSETRVS